MWVSIVHSGWRGVLLLPLRNVRTYLRSPERLRALGAQLAAGAGLAAPDGIEEGLHLVQQQVVAAEQPWV
jgi:hypothetical protein